MRSENLHFHKHALQMKSWSVGHRVRFSQRHLEVLSIELTVEVVGMDKIFEEESLCLCVCLYIHREKDSHTEREGGREGEARKTGMIEFQG